MAQIKRIFCFMALAALFLLASCGKEEPTPIPVNREAYSSRFLEAWNSKLAFSKVLVVDDDWYFTFSGSFSVKVPNGGTIVDDLTKGGVHKMHWKNNRDKTWIIGDDDTGITITTGADFSKSLPVYIWYTADDLNIFFSNGEVMEFHKEGYEPPSPPTPPVKDVTIPVIRLTTENGAAVKSKTTYVPGTIEVLDTTEMYSSVHRYSGKMEIRGRGNSTWSKEKKPYKIKLESKAPLLGMPSDKEWALLANYSDKSLLRNSLAMEISRMLGFAWTPHYAHAEVWLNDEYIGLYDLFEHKEVNGHKIAIDIDGGDIYLEMDKSLDEPVSFKTEKMKLPVMFKDPQNPTSTVIADVKAYLNEFEKTLMGDNASDPVNGYSKYIDIDSFINYFIIQELGKNIDGKLCKSTFLTKKPSGKLIMHHVWDFDLAWGNCNYFTQYYPKIDCGPTGYQTLNYTSNGENTGWYYYLFKNKDWLEAVKARWTEVYPELLKMTDFIDSESKLIRPAVDRNFETWKILGVKVWPNVVYPDTYEEEIAYLKDFYTTRLKWMNEDLMALKPLK